MCSIENAKAKANAIITFFMNSEKEFIEINVNGLGWLVVLRHDVEVVTDNWFTSTKFLASTVELIDEEAATIQLTNVYKINSTFIENANNVKYNRQFDTICVFADSIVAYF